MSNLIPSTQKNLISVNTEKKAVTTSVMVASFFKKRHDHVMRDIDDLVKRGLPNFGESNYLNRQNKTQPMYEMDRTGFTLLAMGFTGDKALEFKIKYIQAFDAMEAELIKQREESVRIAYESKANHFNEIFDRRFEAITKKLDSKLEAINYGVACLKQSLDSIGKAQQADWKEIATGWKNMYSNATEFIEMMKGA